MRFLGSFEKGSFYSVEDMNPYTSRDRTYVLRHSVPSICNWYFLGGAKTQGESREEGGRGRGRRRRRRKSREG